MTFFKNAAFLSGELPPKHCTNCFKCIVSFHRVNKSMGVGGNVTVHLTDANARKLELREVTGPRSQH